MIRRFYTIMALLIAMAVSNIAFAEFSSENSDFLASLTNANSTTQFELVIKGRFTSKYNTLKPFYSSEHKKSGVIFVYSMPIDGNEEEDLYPEMASCKMTDPDWMGFSCTLRATTVLSHSNPASIDEDDPEQVFEALKEVIVIIDIIDGSHNFVLEEILTNDVIILKEEVETPTVTPKQPVTVPVNPPVHNFDDGSCNLSASANMSLPLILLVGAALVSIRRFRSPK